MSAENNSPQAMEDVEGNLRRQVENLEAENERLRERLKGLQAKIVSAVEVERFRWETASRVLMTLRGLPNNRNNSQEDARVAFNSADHLTELLLEKAHEVEAKIRAARGSEVTQ